MFSQEERLASFATASSSASTSAAKKRQSTKAAAASSSLQWPHPVTGRSAKSSGIPTPAILASHGFYHSPTQQSPDAVSHFLYPDIHIDNWQSNDDPLARLEDALPGNGWCRIFRSAQMAIFDPSSSTWTWQESELLPTSKQMVQARKDTFGSQWPYDGKKGWKPTSKKLAEAGFYFNSTQEEPDNARCIYCDKALGGWEKSDDPIHEHQRRKPECAFFNCELRDAGAKSAADAQTEPIDADQDVEPSAPSRRGGKRAVSAATRKASVTVSKGKKSAAAAKPHDEVEDQDEVPADHKDESPATSAETSTQMEEDVEVRDETPAPTKKGGRKTRSVSTKKLAAKAQVEEAQEEAAAQDVAETLTEAEEDEVIAVEEPASKTLSKKKSATGLGNGMAAPASSARPTRAASRRATKAINLLSDEGLNRKLRRPDEEDLERRELALSDPIPFPTAPPTSEDSPIPATDPGQSAAKPKKSRSKSKKLDQEAKAATPKETTPEPQVEEEPMEQDSVRPNEDVTIIEHHDDDGDEEIQEEPVEEPKRRGGRGAKSSSASAPASKASSSSSGSKSRKASTKAAEVEPADEDEKVVGAVKTAKDPLAFPSMSSEADAEPALDRSSRSVSNALKSSGSKGSSQSVSNALKSSGSKVSSSEPASSASSRKGSASSSSKKSSAEPSSAVSEVSEPEIVSQEDSGVDDMAIEDAISGSSLPNTGSQATIRGAPRSSSSVAVLNNTGRTPFAQLPQLTSLGLTETERKMTLGEWLQLKAEDAANEMRSNGEAQMAYLEKELRVGRVAVERKLRGRV